MSDWFQFSQKFHMLTLHCLCFQVNVATQCDPDEIIVLSDSEWPSTSLRTTDCSTCLLYSRISWKRSFLRTVLVCWLVKIFFFFFFKFLLNWMWFKQPLTGVEKQGKLWIWYIVLVNYILPNKSPSACKGLRYNCLKESWLNWTFVFWKIKVLGAFFFYSCVHHSVLLM